MKMPRIWNILKRFKDRCTFRGWKTSETEDWVEVSNTYHNFLWTRDVQLASFKRIASNQKVVIREGLSYHVVKPSCTAWLLSQTPTENLLRIMLENPDFSKRIALYDLSPLLEGKSVCARLNSTGSPVFREFELFLKEELKVKLKSLAASMTSHENHPIVEVA